MLYPAAYAEPSGERGLICKLCPAHCRFREGRRGICGARFMKDGKLVTDNYGEAVTLAVDPIEKKPLYHFFPTSTIFSTGANGCNFKCLNCQNWSISQQKVDTEYVAPEQMADTAGRYNSIGVAFTYTEPMIWFEYIRDTAPLLKERGLKTVLVSNGYIDPEPLEELLPLVDAMNIDLKGIRPEFYRHVCKGKLEPILHNLRRIGDSEVHLEITNLLIPGENDSDDEIRRLVDFVASISELTPLHLSAYRPEYRMDAPATPTESLLKAYSIARDKLKYVFLGNVSVSGMSDSHCPNCEKRLISRTGYRVKIESLEGGRCTSCGAETGIVQ